MVLGIVSFVLGILFLLWAEHCSKNNDFDIFTIGMYISSILGICLGFYKIALELSQIV